MTSEQYIFKAEINELMNMIIHNFYSNNDIFLRELISNSSDAINKLKFESLQDKSILNDFYDFVIKLKLDKENRTIIIEDTGIGMTKNDLINNIGTIAKSGTKEFIKKISSLENKDNSNLIGQFGVGFYSAYLVADSVNVITKHASSSTTLEWESTANGSFTITEIESDLIRGTRIILHLKPNLDEYLETSKITEIIKKHSSYITYPILLHTIKTREVDEEVTDQVVEDVVKEDVAVEDVVKEDVKVEDVIKEDVAEEDVKVEDVEEEEEKNIKKNKKIVQEESWNKINSEPLWSKSPSDVTEEEYEQFYKSLSNDWNKHLTLKHFKAEGNIEFSSILFVPSQAPYDLFERKTKNNIKLYVKKVLISDDCKDLCPEWLNFVKGIVDSNDLPLNASRELLQESKILKQISKHLVKKSIEMITDLPDDKFKTFYENFDKNIKLGIHEEESSNKEKLIELLRYPTSKGQFVSLSEYKERMIETQPGIYYITGESIKGLENSPFVDKIKKLDYEVIYMCDAIDEYIVQQLTTYKDIKMINIAKDDLSIPGNETEEKIDTSKFDNLCERIKKVLNDKIDTVKVCTKIDSQPAIITNPMGISANMERIMKAQTLSNKNSNPMMMNMFSKKSLEISASHPIILKLDESIDSELFNELVDIVYESALLSSGYQVEDINSYLKKIYKYIN